MKPIKRATAQLTALVTVLATAIGLSGCQTGGDSGSSSGQQSGQSGSTSRFTLQNGYLIVTDQSKINSYAINDSETGSSPAGVLQFVDQMYSNRTLETAFAYGDERVMLGTTTGTLIVTVDGEGQLALETTIHHSRSCDPVIASGNRMYVTLSNDGSGFCGGSAYDNHLLAYDITDITNPLLIDEVQLNQPQGLALADEQLWVCTESGLWRFDVLESGAVEERNNYGWLPCDDLIIDQQLAYLTWGSGVTLIDISGEYPQELALINEGD